ncbi:MAG: tetratricopeptide repeat protein [bacterium]|nr:tetratricopeptide repeat protein [bacterium]
MKLFNKYLVLGLAALLLAGAVSVDAKKGRKLQPGAAISSAKIEILSGEEERINTAIALLDTLFMNWGPHAEGLYWMTQIQVDLIGKRADLKVKLPLVERMVAYSDSLGMCCENKDVKKKYRKKCDDYIEEIDSLKVLFWRDYYNSGVSQIDDVGNLMEYVAQETDSSALASYQSELDAKLDSCKDNMTLAIAIDSMDARTYVGLASAYEKTQDMATSRLWLEKALDKTDNRREVLIQLAYNSIQSNDYCDAIPYFNEYIDIITADDGVMSNPDNIPGVVGTMYNLTICYNNCQRYGEAYELSQTILTYDPENSEVLQGSGRYHNQMARLANDSANVYKESDREKFDHWTAQKDIRFDSARVFLKQAFESDPNNKSYADEYGVTCAILRKFDEAAVAFSRISEIDPSDSQNWSSLGDCYLSIQKFDEAANAYEEAVELDPNNKSVVQTLRDLHHQLGNSARVAELEAQLK